MKKHLRSDILSQGDRWARRRKMERKRNPWCDDCNAEYQGDCPECTFIHDDGVFARRILQKRNERIGGQIVVH